MQQFVCRLSSGLQHEVGRLFLSHLGVYMRKSKITIALAAAGLLSVLGTAEARVVLALKSFDDANVLQEIKFCDSNNFGACGAGFSLINANAIGFTGTLLGGFTVTFTSFTGNQPGTPTVATLNASTTELTFTGASGSFGRFEIDLQAEDYTLPAGVQKYLSGSASLTSPFSGVAGESVISKFYADGTNSSLASNEIMCSMSVGINASCNAGTTPWSDINGGTFAMRDIQQFRLASGSQVNTTASGRVTPVPEPMTLSLVGAALLAIGATARRKSK